MRHGTIRDGVGKVVEVHHKAIEVLRWKPTIELHEGLGRTIAYFERLLAAGSAVAAGG